MPRKKSPRRSATTPRTRRTAPKMVKRSRPVVQSHLKSQVSSRRLESPLVCPRSHSQNARNIWSARKSAARKTRERRNTKIASRISSREEEDSHQLRERSSKPKTRKIRKQVRRPRKLPTVKVPARAQKRNQEAQAQPQISQDLHQPLPQISQDHHHPPPQIEAEAHPQLLIDQDLHQLQPLIDPDPHLLQTLKDPSLHNILEPKKILPKPETKK
jgi:hypothetical protein